MVCFPHLHILHGARLRHTQHVEQLQDQLLDVLQGVLLRHEVGVHLLLHLKDTKQPESDEQSRGRAAVRRGAAPPPHRRCTMIE